MHWLHWHTHDICLMTCAYKMPTFHTPICYTCVYIYIYIYTHTRLLRERDDVHMDTHAYAHIICVWQGVGWLSGSYLLVHNWRVHWNMDTWRYFQYWKAGDTLNTVLQGHTYTRDSPVYVRRICDTFRDGLAWHDDETMWCDDLLIHAHAHVQQCDHNSIVVTSWCGLGISRSHSMSFELHALDLVMHLGTVSAQATGWVPYANNTQCAMCKADGPYWDNEVAYREPLWVHYACCAYAANISQ